MIGQRERILQRIGQGKPPETPLPSAFYSSVKEGSLVDAFIGTLSQIGGKACLVSDWQLISEDIMQCKEFGREHIIALPGLPGHNANFYAHKGPAELEKIDTAYLKGSYAIAENGSVWLEEKNMVNRMLPFICQRLVLIVEKPQIVADMHAVYKHINISEAGYGVFIAGPSKTADIEQALVIGAHGPLELMVYIIDQPFEK